jgi:hypothetical protein
MGNPIAWSDGSLLQAGFARVGTNPNDGAMVYMAPDGQQLVELVNGNLHLYTQNAQSPITNFPGGGQQAPVAAPAPNISITTAPGASATPTQAGVGGGLPSWAVWGLGAVAVAVMFALTKVSGKTKSPLRFAA